MKKILTAITLSLGALMATSAMAAPQYYSPHAKKPIQYRYELSNTF
ncbi:hypothetical protein ABLT35_06035 [Acinetobacter johnsonii]